MLTEELYKKLDGHLDQLDKLVVQFNKLKDELDNAEDPCDVKGSIMQGCERLSKSQDWFSDAACTLEMAIDESKGIDGFASEL